MDRYSRKLVSSLLGSIFVDDRGRAFDVSKKTPSRDDFSELLNKKTDAKECIKDRIAHYKKQLCVFEEHDLLAGIETEKLSGLDTQLILSYRRVFDFKVKCITLLVLIKYESFLNKKRDELQRSDLVHFFDECISSDACMILSLAFYPQFSAGINDVHTAAELLKKMLNDRNYHAALTCCLALLMKKFPRLQEQREHALRDIADAYNVVNTTAYSFESEEQMNSIVDWFSGFAAEIVVRDASYVMNRLGPFYHDGFISL